MREKGATERPQAFRYERAPDRYARMPCQYVRLPFHVERTSIRIERMSFRRGRIRGSFRFARDSFLINAISVPLCAISWDYSRSNICNARSIFREKAFHFRAHAHPRSSYRAIRCANCFFSFATSKLRSIAQATPTCSVPLPSGIATIFACSG